MPMRSNDTNKMTATERRKQRTGLQFVAIWVALLLVLVQTQFSDSASLSAPADTKSLQTRLARDRGCYYMLQHYNNGEQIKTDEPCLNCTCADSMLMCYLRVCPYVKPVADRCIIERVPGECCPRITCPTGNETGSLDQVEQVPETSTQLSTTTSTSTSTSTATSAQTTDLGELLSSNATGCQLDDEFYPEGAQMPAAGQGKLCEVCYCIRGRAACVMQDCALEVSGCAPVYAPGRCCPVRYNCSTDASDYGSSTARPTSVSAKRKFWQLVPGKFSEVASTFPLEFGVASPTSSSTTTLRPLVMPEFGRKESASSSLAPGCRMANSSRLFGDGERVPSRNKCEHCYCMRSEIVCAVQECRAPCDGCVPLPNEPGEDQCCPTRYECAAPSQRVPLDNVIYPPAQQEFNTSSSAVATDAQPSLPSSEAPPAQPNVSQQQQQSGAAEQGTVRGDESGAQPSSTTTIVPMLSDDATAASSAPSSSSLPARSESQSADEQPTTTPTTSSSSDATAAAAAESLQPREQEISVMTTRQTKPPLKPISPKLSTASDLETNSFETGARAAGGAVDGFNLNGGEREQDSSDSSDAASKSQVSRVEAPEGHQQQAPVVGPAAVELPLDPTLSSTPKPAAAAANIASSQDQGSPASPVAPAESAVVEPTTPDEQQSKKAGRPLVVQSHVPGEGSCRYNGRVYQNGDEVKSKHNCTELCMCINSVVYCDEVDCPRAPDNVEKCQKVTSDSDCCPKYICPTESSETPAASTTGAAEAIQPEQQQSTSTSPSLQSSTLTTIYKESQPAATLEPMKPLETSSSQVEPSSEAPSVSSTTESNASTSSDDTNASFSIAPAKVEPISTKAPSEATNSSSETSSVGSALDTTQLADRRESSTATSVSMAASETQTSPSSSSSELSSTLNADQKNTASVSTESTASPSTNLPTDSTTVSEILPQSPVTEQRESALETSSSAPAYTSPIEISSQPVTLPQASETTMGVQQDASSIRASATTQESVTAPASSSSEPQTESSTASSPAVSAVSEQGANINPSSTMTTVVEFASSSAPEKQTDDINSIDTAPSGSSTTIQPEYMVSGSHDVNKGASVPEAIQSPAMSEAASSSTIASSSSEVMQTTETSTTSASSSQGEAKGNDVTPVLEQTTVASSTSGSNPELPISLSSETTSSTSATPVLQSETIMETAKDMQPVNLIQSSGAPPPDRINEASPSAASASDQAQETTQTSSSPSKTSEIVTTDSPMSSTTPELSSNEQTATTTTASSAETSSQSLDAANTIAAEQPASSTSSRPESSSPTETTSSQPISTESAAPESSGSSNAPSLALDGASNAQPNEISQDSATSATAISPSPVLSLETTSSVAPADAAAPQQEVATTVKASAISTDATSTTSLPSTDTADAGDLTKLVTDAPASNGEPATEVGLTATADGSKMRDASTSSEAQPPPSSSTEQPPAESGTEKLSSPPEPIAVQPEAQQPSATVPVGSEPSSTPTDSLGDNKQVDSPAPVSSAPALDQDLGQTSAPSTTSSLPVTEQTDKITTTAPIGEASQSPVAETSTSPVVKEASSASDMSETVIVTNAPAEQTTQQETSTVQPSIVVTDGPQQESSSSTPSAPKEQDQGGGSTAETSTTISLLAENQDQANDTKEQSVGYDANKMFSPMAQKDGTLLVTNPPESVVVPVTTTELAAPTVESAKPTDQTQEQSKPAEPSQPSTQNAADQMPSSAAPIESPESSTSVGAKPTADDNVFIVSEIPVKPADEVPPPQPPATTTTVASPISIAPESGAPDQSANTTQTSLPLPSTESQQQQSLPVENIARSTEKAQDASVTSSESVTALPNDLSPSTSSASTEVPASSVASGSDQTSSSTAPAPSTSNEEQAFIVSSSTTIAPSQEPKLDDASNLVDTAPKSTIIVPLQPVNDVSEGSTLAPIPDQTQVSSQTTVIPAEVSSASGIESSSTKVSNSDNSPELPVSSQTDAIAREPANNDDSATINDVVPVQSQPAPTEEAKVLMGEQPAPDAAIKQSSTSVPASQWENTSPSIVQLISETSSPASSNIASEIVSPTTIASQNQIQEQQTTSTSAAQNYSTASENQNKELESSTTTATPQISSSSEEPPMQSETVAEKANNLQPVNLVVSPSPTVSSDTNSAISESSTTKPSTEQSQASAEVLSSTPSQLDSATAAAAGDQQPNTISSQSSSLAPPISMLGEEATTKKQEIPISGYQAQQTSSEVPETIQPAVITETTPKMDQTSSSTASSEIPVGESKSTAAMPEATSEVPSSSGASSQPFELSGQSGSTPANKVVDTSLAPEKSTVSMEKEETPASPESQTSSVAPVAEAAAPKVEADQSSSPEAPVTTTITSTPTSSGEQELKQEEGVSSVSSGTSLTEAQSSTISPADEFLAHTQQSTDFVPVNVTTSIPVRGSSASVTIPWADVSSSTLTPEPSAASNTSSTRVFAYETGEPTSSSASSSTSSNDYDESSGEEPGCEYEGKSYSSAQQIPRSHPCDFCFCFRGDIICLQQTCPPPVPHCFETVIDGFCCPRYECPVHTVRSATNSSSLTLTPYETHSRLHTHTHEPERPQSAKNSTVRGCFVDNKLYGVGQVIDSASGPCLECRCDRSGMMKCNPKECAPEDPLLQQINREVLQSTLSRSQMR